MENQVGISWSSKHSAENNYGAPEQKFQERQDLRQAVRGKEG